MVFQHSKSRHLLSSMYYIINICNLLCDLFVVSFTKSSISLDAISLQLPHIIQTCKVMSVKLIFLISSIISSTVKRHE